MKLNKLVEQGPAKFNLQYSKLLQNLLEKHLKEEMEQESDLVKSLRAAAMSYGSDTGTYQDGVFVTTLKNKQASTDFALWLDSTDYVDGYEIHVLSSDQVAGTVDTDEIEFDSITDDTLYSFEFTVYLIPDVVDYNFDDYDALDMEDEEDSLQEACKKKKMKEQDECDDEEMLDDDDDDEDMEDDELTEKKKCVKESRKKKMKEECDDEAMDDECEDDEEDEDEDSEDDDIDYETYESVKESKGNKKSKKSLNEVTRKIRVDARGTKTIKMKCQPGFKYNPATKTCEKITGAELAMHRKATRKALITKKNEGKALKVRVAKKIRKAKRFRKMLGLAK